MHYTTCHYCCFSRLLASSRNLNRWILPVAVFGSSGTNTIQRGYLNGARRSFTNAFSSSSSAGLGARSRASTTNASGFTSSSWSAAPTTPASTTAGCSASAPSTSAGDTHIPPAEVEGRSEEHTSELQSHSDLVDRLLLEKKNIDWR